MERLLHDRSGVLRLATVTLKVPLGFEAATLAAFDVFFCVSCVGVIVRLFRFIWGGWLR